MEAALERKRFEVCHDSLTNAIKWTELDEKLKNLLVEYFERRLLRWFENNTPTLEVSIGWITARLFFRKYHLERAARELCERYLHRIQYLVRSRSRVIFWFREPQPVQQPPPPVPEFWVERPEQVENT